VRALAFCFLVAATAGCAGEGAAVDSNDDVTCQRIVGGSVDDHSAAVASLEDEWGTQFCSGTLVGSSRTQSVVLTAAHCLDWPITRVLFGDDRRHPDVTAAVSTAVSHPDFEATSGRHDFAVLMLDSRLDGIAPIPVAAPGTDGLQTGTEVEIVGFGDTETDASNAERRGIRRTLSALDSTEFSYRQSDGGPCLGDSGGPAVGTSRGLPAVVGVTSYGLGDCSADGVSGRASATAEFVSAFIQSDCARD
jgi:secreted trypsin-like serine protease